MVRNKYFTTGLGIYISYFMLGMALILLSSNMEFVTKQLNTDVAGITFLISIEGIVRSASVYISGRLSDKFGRKQILCLSPVFEIVFLFGIPFVHDYKMAVLLSAFAGLSHAFVDSSSYPSLMECFPETPGTATVIVKAFIAIGGIMLPIIIAFFVNRNMFYGNTFFLIAIMYLINSLFLFTRKFPKPNQAEVSEDGKILNEKNFISEPVLKKEGLTIIIIGFTSNAIYTAFQIWMPTYGQNILGMSQVDSLKLITYYSIGSLVSVFILAKLLQKTVKPVLVLVIYPIIGIISLILVLLIRTEIVTTIGFTLIGLSSAGVLQMAQTTMGELFWKNKGATMGMVSTAGGIASAVVPALTGIILKYYGILHVFYFIMIIFVVGISCAIFTKIRYDKVIASN
ncbi:MFS transporter [Clostridium saudiense]|uniref:MFS transporter n=1 Tax=Clostridium saudiense TaxID=1414720 RepID=A0ABS2FDD0_9CLOT|nr:MFS transporter [Clostridium saudiense]MBM6818316.1 MFS transporter [Clostridium saudiense]